MAISLLNRKKGIFFTIDAILGSILLVIAILLISNMKVDEEPTTQTIFFSQDTIDSLAELKVSEIDPGFLNEMKNQTDSVRDDSSVLEQIGFLWVKNETDIATNLTKHVLENSLPERYGFSVLVDGETIYLRNKTRKSALITSFRMVSGIEKGRPIEGISSRLFLKGIDKKTSTSYLYFGGFVGQGNITRFIHGIPEDANITEMIMELDAGDDFDLYINNDVCIGTFSVTAGNMAADSWDITSCNTSLVLANDTMNNFSIQFTGNNISKSYLGGGFIKVKYKTSQLISQATEIMYGENFTGTTRYYFPEIEGIINLYSAFHIPGEIDAMNIRLHYFSNHTNTSNGTLYFNLGNKTVFLDTNSTTEQDIILNDTNLSSVLDYTDYDKQTVPIRLGLDNLSYIRGSELGNADVILITDLSFSMNTQFNNSNVGIPRNCSDANIYSYDSKRISVARCLDIMFAEMILNTSGNRIGLVSFSLDAEHNGGTPYYLNDPQNITNISNHIIGKYNATGSFTCVCCPINKAYEMLQNQSNNTRDQYIIVMTDGSTNAHCGLPSPAPAGCFFAGHPYNTQGTTGGINVSVHSALCAARRAAEAVYSTVNNVTVHSIGFGPVINNPTANATLIGIAQWGNGTYYGSDNVTELIEIYAAIADQISSFSRKAQTVEVEGNYSRSIIYQDSYIEVNYTHNIDPPEFGEIAVNFESDKFQNCTPKVSVPSQLRVIESKVTSYSSDYWTDLLKINSNTVFDLSRYSANYSKLGDPFVIGIPTEEVISDENEIEIKTGDSPTNITGCSKNNSMMYTALLDASFSYSSVLPNAEGCSWNVEIEPGDINTSFSVPENYAGSKLCNFTNNTIGYDDQDTYDVAVLDLLEKLDLDNDRRIDILFGETDIIIATSTIRHVPYMWGPTIVEVRIWQ